MKIVHQPAFNRVFCDCGAELHSADDMSRHRRQHTLELYSSTAEGRRILQGLRDCGFKDQPDDWRRW
jgi:hypothetical protein